MDQHLIKIDPEKHSVATTATSLPPLFHYYGDAVRRLFVAAAIIITITTPIVSAFLTLPTFSAIIGALFLVIVAGLTNPSERWSSSLNLTVAVLGAALFQYRGIADYLAFTVNPAQVFMFTVDEVLAVIFIIAVYYSSKTFRRMFVK
ncbi:hypothetical protein COV04_01180 [Candidatus Uhrbacteria bacterium CG10_big_fil_rev_8_21_14_0_10_48_11]|uniref:Uncharacterized protein n=1 Tax=Candidatus Uhrbacteria bacterium CG10_big_fil_rev_8_21_14_0_10_48_11 TaxID=1975037 RepID=A0A2M8LFB7_9BACT|nr:MAG: hypothetical protein COV04_01180 [Candidatus Uhrbacteria bacterium CG10_big_fil_rev_8_21_14_0_10_48_11]